MQKNNEYAYKTIAITREIAFDIKVNINLL